MTCHIGPILAQLTSGLLSIYGWSFLLIALLVALFVAVWWARKRAVGSGQSGTGTSFTLSDLRKMREGGQINQEQYEKLREQVIGAIRAEVPEEPPRT
jgi:hypothetical protein